MKKVMSFLLALTLCVGLCVPAFAAERSVGITEIMTQAELNRFLENTTRDTGEAKTVFGDPQTKTVTGYAGDSLSLGYKVDSKNYPTYLYYESSGGPNKSVSFSFAVPFAPISVGVNLGQRSNGTVGQLCPTNNGYGYYKVFVEKTITIKPFIAYYRVGPGAPWEKVLESYVKDDVSVYAYASKVANL